MDSLFVQALGKANIGMLIVDKDLRIVLWNHWLKNYTGITQEEVYGKQLTDICPRFKINIYLNILHKTLYHGQSRFCSSALHKAFIIPKDVGDADSHKQNLYIEPLHEGESRYALIQISDMTKVYNKVYKLENLVKKMEIEYDEIMAAEKHSRHLSLHDSLTNLPNRLAFHDQLASAIQHAQGNGNMLAVLFLDVDGFKSVNDKYGHDVGDKVIIEVANRMKECVKETDTVARFGGDEFVALLPQLHHPEDVAIVADKFVRAMDHPFDMNGELVRLSISVGISTYPRSGHDPSSLIRKADQAMYQIKASGKNAYGFVENSK